MKTVLLLFVLVAVGCVTPQVPRELLAPDFKKAILVDAELLTPVYSADMGNGR